MFATLRELHDKSSLDMIYVLKKIWGGGKKPKCYPKTILHANRD